MNENQYHQSQDADELYAYRHDADEWEDTAELIEVQPSGFSVVSICISAEDLDVIEQAATQAHQTVSAYIRAMITTAVSQITTNKQ